MYVTFDLVSPVLSKSINQRRFKADFLRLWPTKMVNDVEVMDDFRFWDGSAKDTKDAKEIYAMLGTTVEDLDGEDYAGVDYAYFKLDPSLADANMDYGIPIVEAIIDRRSTTDERSFELHGQSQKYYRNLSGVYLDSTQQLEVLELALGTGEHAGLLYDLDYGDEFVVLMDNDEVYDKVITSNGQSGTLATDGSTTNMTNNAGYASFTVRYSLKADYTVTQGLVNKIEAITMDNLEVSHYGVEYNYDKSDYISSMYAQKKVLYLDVVQTDSSDLYMFIYDDDDDGYTRLVRGYIKAEGLRNLAPVVLWRNKQRGVLEFADVIDDSFDTGYKKKSVKTWKKLVGFVSVIVIVVGTIMSGGTAGPALYTAIGATAVLMGASYYEANYGNPHAASMYGDMLTIASVMSAFIGITAAMNKMMEEGTKTLMVKYAEMRTIELIGVMLGHANTVFNYVAQWDMRKDASELSSIQRNIQEQEDIMDAMPTAVKYEQQKWEFETYNFLEINEKMDQVPYMMTQGKIDEATHKYF